MKSHTYKLLVATASLSLLSFIAFSGPIRKADLPAEPVWVLHLDCDALRPTAVGQWLLSEMAKPEPENKLTAFRTMFGFDPRNALHGLTLYATAGAPEDGVLLAHADFDAGRLSDLAKGAKDYRAATHRHHTIHNWVDEKKKAKDGSQPRTYAAIHGNKVIFGQREQAVAQALDVLDGIAPSLSGALASLLTPAPGKFLQAAALRLPMAAGNPQAAIFRLADSLQLDVAETGRQVTMALSLQAKDEPTASSINSIAQGLMGLMRLDTEKPLQQKAAEALELRQDGSAVVLNLTMPSVDMVEMLKASAARKAKRQSSN